MKADLRHSTGALAAFVALAAVIVYANSIANGFALDDVFIVQRNPNVTSPGSLRDVLLTPYWPFSGPELGLYRPGTIFLFALQWAAGDGAPWVFHAVNVLLHAAASVLGFMLLRRLAGSIPAFFGALVFAVHPVHTEAVANVVGQAEIVAGLAVLAACLVHSGRPAGTAVSWPRRLALCALFAAGLTAKESTVVLPALLVILDFAQRRVRLTVRGFAQYADAVLMTMLLLAATLALYLIVRLDVMAGALIGVDAAPSMPYLREEHRVLNALRAFPEFLRLLIFPLDLAADYSPAALLPVETVRPMVVLGALLLAAFAALSLLTPWLPSAGFPAAWFLISIITVSNLFFPIGVLVAERTLYLPSFALSAFIALGWKTVSRVSDPARRLALGVLVLAIVAGGVRTWVRNPAWANTRAVWNALMRDQPESYRAQWVAGQQLWGAGRVDAAALRFELAYRIYDRDAQFLTEYANFLIGRNEWRRALDILETADTLNPGYRRNTTLLAHAYLAAGDYDAALNRVREAERLGVPLSATLPVRAQAHQRLGDFDSAAGAWRLARARAESGHGRLYAFLARALAAGGHRQAALAAVDSAGASPADSAALPLLERVEAAIRSGCYRRLVAPADAQPGTPFASSCDEIGDWFDYGGAAQNATELQNAMDPVLATPSTNPDTVP